MGAENSRTWTSTCTTATAYRLRSTTTRGHDDQHHETPLALFPGTGFSEEIGTSGAEGTAVNVPLPVGAADAEWLRAFHAVVPGLLRAFGPAVAADPVRLRHAAVDPLADLRLSVDGQRASYCHGKTG